MSQDTLKTRLYEQVGKFSSVPRKLRRYSLIMFLVLVGCVYGFILWRANSLNSVQPSADAVSSQVKAARLPHIDQSVVNQLQSLQDNSVNVQALFDQERNNPFQ